MKRLLVTTALEETWGNNVPVIFLGEWCRPYDRKHIWSEMDALVALPFGVDPEQKLSDADYVDELADQILVELTEALNDYHQVQHNKRFWNTILGHWLKRYVSVAFNRYYTLDQALKNYEIDETVVFEDADYSLATSDSLEFIYICNDRKWNHLMYSRIMAFRGDLGLKQVPILSADIDDFHNEQEKNGEVLSIFEKMKKVFDFMVSRDMKTVILRMLGEIGAKFSRDTDAFIIYSYLPIKEDFKLQLALGQVPKVWRCPSPERGKVDLEQRRKLDLNCDRFEGFEKYVRWQLPEVIPTCYLEGYRCLLKMVGKVKWPKKPRFIFTSGAFDVHEVFKVWTALKVEQGVSYFTGQHGARYGTHAWDGTWCSPERATSDKLITWGWAEDESNIIPAFVFTNVGRKPQPYNNSGGLLLVETCMLQNIWNYDTHFEYGLYMEEQYRFAENLPDHIRQEMTVRLHSQYKKMRFFEDHRWKDQFLNVKIDTGSSDVRKLISESRLVVYSYDSTGILEALALNIPVICFFEGGLNHLLPDAKPYYELLENAGILFCSPESAAEFIATHWDDFGDWWGSKKVQDGRKVFCQQYARTVDHPVLMLKDILTENL